MWWRASRPREKRWSMETRWFRAVRAALLSLMCLSGCERSLSRSQPEFPPAAAELQPNLSQEPVAAPRPITIPTLSASIIAERVHARYRNAKFIHIEEIASRNGQSVHYKYDGSRDSLRTLAMHDGSLYGAFSMHNGRVQEFVPEHPHRLLLEYDAEMTDQIPWLVYPRELDCVYGMAFGIWIGPQSLTRFGERMAESEIHEPQVVNGRACYVLEWQRGSGEPGSIVVRHIYYVDAVDFVIRRWTTYQNDIRQDREFLKMDLSEQPVECDWDVWPLVEQILDARKDKW